MSEKTGLVRRRQTGQEPDREQSTGQGQVADLFLCGPLSQAPVARIVLGPEAGVQAAQSSKLRGYAPGQTHDGGLVVAVPRPGAVLDGVLMPSVPENALARLRYFLAVFGADLVEARMEGKALLVPVGGDVTDKRAGGSPVAPVLSDGLAALERVAADIMAHADTYSADQMAARLPAIRARAQMWVRQRDETAGSGPADVKVHAVHRPYLNFFSVQEVDVQFRRADGTMSDVINRGALEIGEAAGVLPYDPVDDSVVLIRQFRAPVLIGGSQRPWVWEPAAGLVDAGETPEETVHREAMEEAGVTLWHLEPVGPVYCSPGCLSDRLNLFVGLTDVTRMVDAGGLASENEDITREVVGFETFLRGIDDGRYNVLPLIMLGLWLARHRDRLRAMA